MSNFLTKLDFSSPPNFWVVSIRILNGVAGHGRCRSVGRWPNSFVNSRVKCNLTLTRVKVAARTDMTTSATRPMTV